MSPQQHAFLPASSYNKLPHIDDMEGVADKNSSARDTLLEIISSHGLNRQFSIHLVHKHFNLAEGKVMVYETVRGPNHPDYMLCSPQNPEKYNNIQGLYYQVCLDGTMAAYEYTTDSIQDISKYSEFVAEFAVAVLRLGVKDVFALTAKQPETKRFSEFELSDLCSTILVANPSWLPNTAGNSTSTDWISSASIGPHIRNDERKKDGIITLTDCTKTTSGGHYNFTCSKTRDGTHYQQKPATWEDNGGKVQEQLFLDGELVPVDSEPFIIINSARKIIECS